MGPASRAADTWGIGRDGSDVRMQEQQEGALEARMAHVQPELRPPAALLRQMAEALAGERVQLLSSDLRSLGFGAYAGQVCLVTPTRVVLATGMQVQGADAAFGVEVWPRETGPLPLLRSLHPRAAAED